MIDEELLRPSREAIARIDVEINRQQELAARDVDRYGYGSREYARRRWAEFYMTVEPIRREREYVAQIIADYYGLQPMPQSRLTTAPRPW